MRVSSPPASSRPANSPPWKCGTSPAGGAQQRRLAGARPARQHDELARRDRQVEVAQRRGGRVRVAVAHALEGQRRAHGSIPRRSANGSSTHSASTAQSPSCARRPAPRTTGRPRTPRCRATCAAIPSTHERDGARREREVVARPRPAAPARRPPGGAVAAHLERRRDVDGAVQRARRDRADDRPARRRLPREAALRVAEPARVAPEHRHEPRRERRGERRAERDPPERAQQVVGVDRGGVQREAADHDERAQREHAAVRGRLGGDVELAEAPGTVPSRAITVSPSRTTSGLTSPTTSANGSREREREQHAPGDAARPRRPPRACRAARPARAGGRTRARRAPARRTRPTRPRRASACSGLARRR